MPTPPEGYLLVNQWLAGVILTAAGAGFAGLGMAVKALWDRDTSDRKDRADLLREMVASNRDTNGALSILKDLLKDVSGRVEQLGRER